MRLKGIKPLTEVTQLWREVGLGLELSSAELKSPHFQPLPQGGHDLFALILPAKSCNHEEPQCARGVMHFTNICSDHFSEAYRPQWREG